MCTEAQPDTASCCCFCCYQTPPSGVSACDTRPQAYCAHKIFFFFFLCRTDAKEKNYSVFMAHLHKFNKRKIEMKHLLYSFGVNSVIFSHQTHTRKQHFVGMLFSNIWSSGIPECTWGYGSRVYSAFINMMSASPGSRFKEVPSPKNTEYISPPCLLLLSPPSQLSAKDKSRKLLMTCIHCAVQKKNKNLHLESLGFALKEAADS